jgi:hypothetical protein
MEPSGEQSVVVWVVVLGGLALIAGALYALDRWYARKYPGQSPGVATRAGAGMLELQSLLEPGKRHVLEARQQKRKEDGGAGDDEDTSGRAEP